MCDSLLVDKVKFDPPLRKETEAHHELVCDSEVVLLLFDPVCLALFV